MRAKLKLSKEQAEENQAYPLSGWWARLDSNQEPTDYESAALTVELRAPCASHILHIHLKGVATGTSCGFAPGQALPVKAVGCSQSWLPRSHFNDGSVIV